jgi:hypothetical protein
MTMKKSPLNARRAACWEKTRAKGMAHFIIVRGILGWGLPTGLLVPLIHHLFFHSYYSMREATVSIIVYALAGISFGYWMWTYGENAYRSYRSQQELKSLDELSAKP